MLSIHDITLVISSSQVLWKLLSIIQSRPSAATAHPLQSIAAANPIAPAARPSPQATVDWAASLPDSALAPLILDPLEAAPKLVAAALGAVKESSLVTMDCSATAKLVTKDWTSDRTLVGRYVNHESVMLSVSWE